MNKDVIYIEPEDDITDILANIKGAKNKIVALVPPKKAGVLRSAVNFKLIAKAALRENKTVVLISSDESLLRLAAAVKMPVSKTLQSKPEIPKADNLKKEDDSEQVIEEEKPVQKVPVSVAGAKSATAVKPKAPVKTENLDDTEEDVEEDEPVITRRKDNLHPPYKTVKPEGAKRKPEVMELDDEEKPATKINGKKPAKGIPNFVKYRKFIILGGVALVGIIAFVIWGFVIAPGATIDVTIKTSASSFAEDITFVKDKNLARPEDGVFYIEEKSVKKKDETEFEATGELDKGQKATGTIQITIPAGTSATKSELRTGASIQKGANLTFGEVAYKVTEGASITLNDSDVKCSNGGLFSEGTCALVNDVSFGTISIEASENGDKYNIAAATSGWTLSVPASTWYSDNLKFSSSEMKGGSSEIAKIVSKEDIEKAKTLLSIDGGGSKIKDELAEEFDSEYLMIADSIKASDEKYTSSPDLEAEVKDNKKAKLTVEKTYTAFAVKRSDINDYIAKKTQEKNGDGTQVVYSTGVTGFEKKLTSDDDVSVSASKDSVFFESFKNTDAGATARLKSTVLIAPEINEQMVFDKSLGKKEGEVQTSLKSINGVTEVNTSIEPFFSHNIPDSKDRVTVTIKLQQN